MPERRRRMRVAARNLLAGLLLALVSVGCGKSAADATAEERQGRPRSVITALGRVVPGRAAISIAAQPGSRLLELAVTDGQKVNAGEMLALLESHPPRKAERDAAQVALAEARERLETENAYGAALIEQNRQAVRVLDIAVERERKELKRVQSLTAALAGRSLDDQQFAMDSREAELAKAKAELTTVTAALERTRSAVAVKSAEARLKVAEAELETTILRAPIAGEILKVFTYPGERIGDDPILKMGDTDDMHVIAEVHETDIAAVRVAQRATIASPALPEPVPGVVTEIGGLVHRNDVLDLDPRSKRDARVVEVRVKLDRSEALARLTNLEVTARIETALPPAVTKSAAR